MKEPIKSTSDPEDHPAGERLRPVEARGGGSPDMERRYLALSENPVFLMMILSGGRVTYTQREGRSLLRFSLRERPRFLLRHTWRRDTASRWKNFWNRAAEPNSGKARVLPCGFRRGVERCSIWPSPRWNTGVNRQCSPWVRDSGTGRNDPAEEADAPAGIPCPRKPPGGGYRQGLRSAVHDRRLPERSRLHVERSPEAGRSMLELLPEGDRGLPFRLAVEKALAGEGAEIGQEAGEKCFFHLLRPGLFPEGQISGISLVLCEKTDSGLPREKSVPRRRNPQAVFPGVRPWSNRRQGRRADHGMQQGVPGTNGPFGKRPEGKTLGDQGLLPFGSLKNALFSGIGGKKAPSGRWNRASRSPPARPFPFSFPPFPSNGAAGRSFCCPFGK